MNSSETSGTIQISARNRSHTTIARHVIQPSLWSTKHRKGGNKSRLSQTKAHILEWDCIEIDLDSQKLITRQNRWGSQAYREVASQSIVLNSLLVWISQVVMISNLIDAELFRVVFNPNVDCGKWARNSRLPKFALGWWIRLRRRDLAPIRKARAELVLQVKLAQLIMGIRTRFMSQQSPPVYRSKGQREEK